VTLPVLSLGEGFADEVEPAHFPRRDLRFRNQRWAARVGLGELDDEAWLTHFAQFRPLPDNLERPLALRYHGHQFDVYNSALGDGRGFLFAQLVDSEGRLLDLGTKGSGRTPYSRGGDGKLTLKGGIREVLASEMLEALGVYTSISLSLVETGEALERGDEPSPTRSSVLVRLSHSHVRIGSFQRHYAEGREDRVRQLLEYSAEHLLPELGAHANLPWAFLREVCLRSARLTAEWLVAGFVHGVLNSDNMTVTGESFDYGPYRFLPTYDPDFVAAYFDHSGLYAYGRQPRAVYRNLLRLAQSLSPLDPNANWQSAVDGFVDELRRARTRLLLGRLGLASADPDADEMLAEALWDFMGQTQIGFEGCLFDWWGGELGAAKALQGPRGAFYRLPEFAGVRQLLAQRAPTHAEKLALPYFQAPEPVSLVIEEIERVWTAIDQRDDFAPFTKTIGEIRSAGAALGLAHHEFGS